MRVFISDLGFGRDFIAVFRFLAMFCAIFRFLIGPCGPLAKVLPKKVWQYWVKRWPYSQSRDMSVQPKSSVNPLCTFTEINIKRCSLNFSRVRSLWCQQLYRTLSFLTVNVVSNLASRPSKDKKIRLMAFELPDEYGHANRSKLRRRLIKKLYGN